MPPRITSTQQHVTSGRGKRYAKEMQLVQTEPRRVSMQPQKTTPTTSEPGMPRWVQFVFPSWVQFVLRPSRCPRATPAGQRDIAIKPLFTRWLSCPTASRGLSHRRPVSLPDLAWPTRRRGCHNASVPWCASHPGGRSTPIHLSNSAVSGFFLPGTLPCQD